MKEIFQRVCERCGIAIERVGYEWDEEMIICRNCWDEVLDEGEEEKNNE